jgi:hypothetical protein
MSNALPQESNPEKKWWLAIHGVAEGPYTAGYILASLRARTIGPETQACPVGAQEWKPLANLAEFSRSQPLPPPPPPPPPPPSIPGSSDPGHSIVSIGDPRLPKMADCICAYCILWRPLVSLFALVNWAWSPAIVVLAPPTSLLATGAFVTGGILFRNRRKDGLTIIRLTVWACLGVTVLFFLGFVFAASAAMGSDSAMPMESGARPQSGTGAGAGALMPLIWIFDLAFQIATIVWLRRHADALPFSRAQSVATPTPKKWAADTSEAEPADDVEIIDDVRPATGQ